MHKKTCCRKSQFKINALLPGFVYEHGLSDKKYTLLRIEFGFGYTSDSFGNTWTFYPYINEQFRHYYNLEKRQKRVKSLLVIQAVLLL
jgi:hypothetical protein